jgi:hypothetical protein
MSTSPNLQISLIASNQASKEITANAGTVILDLALTNELVTSMADADYTLVDPTEARQNMVFVFTGTLTANRNIIVPTSEKLYIVKNGTTGGHALTVKTSSGTGIPVASTDSYVPLYADGTNVVLIGKLVGTTSGTVAAGDDSRIVGAEQTSNKDAANGYAGLDSGTKLKATEFPALTGDVTSTSGTVATTVVKINGASVPTSDSFVGTNGSGQIVAAPFTPENAANKDAASGYAGLDSNTKLSRHELLGQYTVAALPTGTTGDLAYATNGRKVGEGVGAGTGVPVYFSNAQWRVFSTDAQVLA